MEKLVTKEHFRVLATMVKCRLVNFIEKVIFQRYPQKFLFFALYSATVIQLSYVSMQNSLIFSDIII